MSGPETKYLCDEMLGALARWLRMLGHDAEYVRGLNDTEILRRAKHEGRLLLTRDDQLASRAGKGGLYVRSPDLDRQLVQIRNELGVRFRGESTRCSHCGALLIHETKEEAAGHVPDGALKGSSEFYRCPGCGRRYWDGTHWKSIVERAERLGLKA
jgi:uncharacterized protein with PIN domain